MPREYRNNKQIDIPPPIMYLARMVSSTLIGSCSKYASQLFFSSKEIIVITHIDGSKNRYALKNDASL